MQTIRVLIHELCRLNVPGRLAMGAASRVLPRAMAIPRETSKLQSALKRRLRLQGCSSATHRQSLDSTLSGRVHSCSCDSRARLVRFLFSLRGCMLVAWQCSYQLVICKTLPQTQWRHVLASRQRLPRTKRSQACKQASEQLSPMRSLATHGTRFACCGRRIKQSAPLCWTRAKTNETRLGVHVLNYCTNSVRCARWQRSTQEYQSTRVYYERSWRVMQPGRAPICVVHHVPACV